MFLKFTLPLHDHLPEPPLLLLVRQDCQVRHAGLQTPVQPAFLALASVLPRHDAPAAALANERADSLVLVRPPEEGPAAEANDAAVVADVLLVGLGNGLAGEAVGQVVAVVGIRRKQIMFHFDSTVEKKLEQNFKSL
jgi:hypothetical protein